MVAAMAALHPFRVGAVGPVIHQRVKDLSFAAMRPLARMNHYRYRIRPPRRPERGYRLHLGSGDKYLPGCLNVDANGLRKVDLWLDLRNGLPFADDAVGAIYTFHTLEHFYPDEVHALLGECRRVLEPGGVIRIAVPNLRTSVEMYVRRRLDWFSAWPRPSETLGGRLSNYLFCDGQHRTAFDFDYLAEMLAAAGFVTVVERQACQSEAWTEETLRRCEGDESDPPRSLYVEAVK